MDNGLGWKLVNASPMGLATARSLGTGSWRVCLVVESELGHAPKDLEKDSRLGHVFWRGRVVWAGHGAHASLDVVPGSRFWIGRGGW